MEVSTDFKETLYKMPLTPLNIRKLYLLLARQLYNNPNNYGVMKDQFKQYVYPGTLRVDLESVLDPKDDTRQYPMVLIGLRGLTFDRLMSRDELKTTKDGKGQIYIRNATGQLIISHVAMNADEALGLADISMPFFNAVRVPLKEINGGFKWIEIEEFGAVSRWRADENSPYKGFVAPLVIKLVFEVQWYVELESHVLKTISLADFKTLW